MKFSYLAQVFNELSKENSRNNMVVRLSELLLSANAQEAQYISYLALGRLRAIYKGTQFNFGQKSVFKVVASLVNQDVSEFKKHVDEAGSIAQAIRELNWPYLDTGITLLEMHAILSNLEETSGTGSQEEKSKIFADLLKSVDALSASYIVSIVLGALRIGFSDMTLLDAFSMMVVGNKSAKKQIEHAYNIRADIGQIVYLLKKYGLEKLKELEPEIGIPIRPAAAERLNTAKEIIDKIGPCYAEPKLDGFRVQVHFKRIKDDSGSNYKIWFYSRNLQDMSEMFPELVKAFASCAHDQVILEGEAIVYDEQTDRFLPFQQTVKRKRKHGIEEASQEYPLRLYLFDILYINNNSVMQKPYFERHELLSTIFGECINYTVKVSPKKLCSTAPELKNYFLDQISEGLEGLVVKRPDSPYTPGKRNYNWIKLKRTQEGELTDTIDGLVIGYNYGKGRRAEFGIGAFLIAVYNKELDKFQSIAKVGTGLSDQEWKLLKKNLDSVKVAEMPRNYQVSKDLYPDVWVAPEFVVEVEAEEITRSPNHTAGYKDGEGLALRFPRFLRHREDKDSNQATTVQEVRHLFELQYNKISKNK